MLTTLAMALEGLVSTGATYFTTAALTGAARLLATALAEPAQDGPPTGVYLAALDVGTRRPTVRLS